MKSAAKWWPVAFLALLVVEGGVCMLLFIPQAGLLARVRGQQQILDQQVAEIKKTPETLQHLTEQVGQSKKVLLKLRVGSSERAQEAIMGAVARASSVGGVRLLSLTPIKPASSASAPPAQPVKSPVESWRLRLKGDFAGLGAFLNELEQAGMLFDSRDFTADAVKERGSIELDVVLKTWSADSSAGLGAPPEERGRSPATAGKPGARSEGEK
jgi:hypothetical protein